MPATDSGGDSGVSRRMAGAFMTQMQDIKESVMWFFTANSVENLHEAFLADDRVDAVVYVHMPSAAQLAAGWQMYLQKYFPAEAGGKAFPRHVETDFTKVLAVFEQTPKPNYEHWAARFLPTLLCLYGTARAVALKDLRDYSARLADLLDPNFTDSLFIDDTDWTIARIKSVCRLARKRNRSLTAIARTMPRRQAKLAKAIKKLEAWAEDEAIDAETGVAYVRHAADDSDETPRHAAGKVRRRVRRPKDEEAEEAE